MRVQIKQYTLTNTEGHSHQVTRYDRRVNGENVQAWALKDGRKLEPTEDGYLEHKVSKMLFVMPDNHTDEGEPNWASQRNVNNPRSKA
jgi:hypothetical protein